MEQEKRSILTDDMVGSWRNLELGAKFKKNSKKIIKRLTKAVTKSKYNNQTKTRIWREKSRF